MASTNEITGQPPLGSFDKPAPPGSLTSQPPDVPTILIENIRDAVIVTDKNYYITGWNKGAEEIYGYTKQEALGKKASDIIQTQFSTESERDQWQKALDSEAYWQGEVIQKKKNNENIDILASIAYVKNNAGAVIGAVAINRDITLQKTAEEKIKESGQRFSAAIEAVQGILWTNNARGEMEGEQKGWAALTGQNYEEYRGYGWATAVHPEDAQPSVDAWNEAVQECKTFVFEHRVKMKDGNWGLFSVRAIPLLNGDGSIREWVGVHTNITEQRKAEETIRENAERFRTLANSISQLAWMAQADGWIYWYNQRWYDYTGTTLEEMQGWGWEKVHHPEHIDRVIASTKQAWKGNEPFEMTFPLRGKDQKFRWFLTRVYPVKDAAGKVIEWIGTNTDIDDYKKAMELKDEFLSIASHELKTPLTSLKGFSHILELNLVRDGNEDALNLLSKMNRQVDKLTTLVLELLDVTKIENGQMLFVKESFDFNELVTEIADELQRTTQEHQITVTLEDPITIPGDRNRIGQVITNLISNAIKYSPGAGEVIITSYRDPGHIKLCVRDFGIGIPKASLENIFDRFFRVPGQHMQTFPGLGLGLFISAEIIKRHNGKFEVESDEGKGSVFSFTLPLV